MLTLTLRQLERDGLVLRTVYATVPPRVDYALTPLGESVLEPLTARNLDVDECEANPVAVVQHPFTVNPPTHQPRVSGAAAEPTGPERVPRVTRR